MQAFICIGDDPLMGTGRNGCRSYTTKAATSPPHSIDRSMASPYIELIWGFPQMTPYFPHVPQSGSRRQNGPPEKRLQTKEYNHRIADSA
jgi:hypothetical protein